MKEKFENQEQEEINENMETSDTCENQNEESQDELKDITAKLAETQDRYLRLSAEFDNYRKRTLKERMELVKTAGEDMISDLLPVIDDFDRAIEVMETSLSVDTVLEGTKLIYNKLKSILENRGLTAIFPLGDKFDADIHEAIAKAPSAKAQKGKIIDVVQKGYSLNDKIIRHPKVVVGE